MEKDPYAEAAERIIAARHAAGLSKGALAERIGVRMWAIDRVESGKVEPAIELLQSIAAATLCPLEWLRGHDAPPFDLRPAPLPAEDEEHDPAGPAPAAAIPSGSAELAALRADRDRLTAERGRLARELADLRRIVAAREEALARREAALTAREEALDEEARRLAAQAEEQAAVAQAIVRREIRLESAGQGL